VHGQLVEARRGDQQVPGDAGDGAVAGGLDADAQPERAGEAHRGGDVLRGPRVYHGGRPDGHGQVPRRDERAVPGVVGRVHRAGQDGVEHVERGVDGSSLVDGGVEE
jgi:hypothetical protein